MRVIRIKALATDTLTPTLSLLRERGLLRHLNFKHLGGKNRSLPTSCVCLLLEFPQEVSFRKHAVFLNVIIRKGTGIIT